jgi:hypothetical protein
MNLRLILLGKGGEASFRQLVELEDMLVAAVDTLRTLALLLLYLDLFLPLNAVKAEDEVVVVDTLATEGA